MKQMKTIWRCGFLTPAVAMALACGETPKSSLEAGRATADSSNGADAGASNNDGSMSVGMDAGFTPGADGGNNMMMGNCPHAAKFIDVTLFAGPGGDYPSPTLSVSCTADHVMVASNGIPHYAFQAVTPNDLSAQDYNWQLPRNPTLAQQTSTVPLLGPAGIAVNGLPFYGPNEAQMPDPYGDPILNGITDANLGHTAAQGDYHYHAFLVNTFWPNAVDGEASPIIAYAFDGFPIYGPYGCVDNKCTQVIEFKSGWDAIGYESVDCNTSADCTDGYRCNFAMVGGVEQKICGSETYAWAHNEYKAKDGHDYLDECNGRIGLDGTYRYHVTRTFPYILGCYKGTAIGQGRGMGGMMGMGPPQHAIDACNGLSEGDMCTTTTPMGNPIQGTCTLRDGTLFCRPEGGRPPGG